MADPWFGLALGSAVAACSDDDGDFTGTSVASNPGERVDIVELPVELPSV